MNVKKVEDVKDIALKLDKIRSCCPKDFYCMQGWIQCLLYIEGMGFQVAARTVQTENPPKVDSQTL